MATQAQFIDALQAWFYQEIHDEAGLDAFNAWLTPYETEPRTPEQRDTLRHVWGNGDSVALDVYDAEGATFVQQDHEYAWLIPDGALADMPRSNQMAATYTRKLMAHVPSGEHYAIMYDTSGNIAGITGPLPFREYTNEDGTINTAILDDCDYDIEDNEWAEEQQWAPVI